MKSLVVNSWEVKGIERSAPFRRTWKIIMAPDLHKNRDLAICQVIVPVGSRSDAHSHEIESEYWIVTEGRGYVEIDGEKTSIEPGSVAYAAPKTSHAIINTGEEPLKAYFLFAPPGPEKKLIEMIQGKIKS